MTTKQSPARQALQQHRDRLAALLEQGHDLDRKISNFSQSVAVHDALAEQAQAVRSRRVQVLEAVAIGEAKHAALDDADRELRDAEAKATGARRESEIAEAGSARLQRERDQLQPQIAAAQRVGDALRYSVSLEIAAGRLDAYLRTARAFADSHAQLLAGLLLADEFAAPTATPSRPFMAGSSPAPIFEAWRPELPGLDASRFNIDATDALAGALESARKELEG